MRLGTPPTDAASARAQTWRAIAAAKAVAADEAAKKWEEARKAATRAAADASRHVKDLRRVEGAVHRAEAQVKDAEHTLAKPNLPPAVMQKAEEMKAKATERLTAAQAQLDAVKAVAQPLIDAATAAREAARAADAAKASAQNEAKIAAAKLAPVSVFISRKTQRLYVRQAFQPIFDSPIAISDPDTPIGTFVFTALNYANEGADVRWNALAMYADAADREPEKRPASRRGHRDAEPTPSDPAAAKAALDRISIPQEVVERVNEVLSPGSSVIVSDEGPSRETGKGTDFVVVMSDEPQGALKIRKRNPYSSYGYDRGYRYRYRGYYGGPFSWW
jgi:hypothetical protein